MPIIFLFVLLTESIAFASQANVFVYHRFNDSRYPSTNIALHDFRAHLELLRDYKFNVLTLGEIVEKLQAGRELPERCAAITIDDAFRSFLTDGWPLLKEFGFPATLFVSTDSVGGGDYLNWQELKQLVAEGVEVGNHSAAHSYLLDNLDDDEWRERIADDLQRSQKSFSVNLGTSPPLFAYPYGEYSPELIRLVKQAGFSAAVGQQSGVIAPGQDMFTLPRFPMGAGFVTLESFRSKLLMKHLPLDVVSPKSPVIIDENPPKIRFYLNSPEVSESTMNCFVPGRVDCLLRLVDEASGLYEVQAESPLKGRRSKYTVTASDRSGRTWFWFSQLWVLPRLDAVTDDPVSR